MGEQIKRVALAFIFILLCNICLAQTEYSFFKVEKGIHYSKDNGLTWYAATDRCVVNPSTIINNPQGKRYALVDNAADIVYWCEVKGKTSVTDIIKSTLRKNSFFSGLFSEIKTSNNQIPAARYDRRGGVKMGGNNDVYIESVVAYGLRQGPKPSSSVRYNIVKSTRQTFYFEIVNATPEPLQFIIVQYDKKKDRWNIPFNYKYGNKEVVLTIPGNTVVPLSNIEFKTNAKKKYYLVALSENLELSWENLQKELNSYKARPTKNTQEPTLHIYTE